MVYGLWGRIWFTFACLCTVEPICNGEIVLAIVITYMKVERIKIKTQCGASYRHLIAVPV
jgi:hypothetical protein